MPIRWTSSATLLEYPLVSIALGPDPSKSELRGHARAIIAIGDIATGVIAPGGVARAAVALGGLAIGGIVLGGCGIGILALAGLALGCLAMGGLAIGYAAIGGLAVGYYAMGGAAFGQFVIGPLHQDPPGSRILFQTLARPAYSAWTKAEIAHALTCRRFAEYGRW